jgi:hypothetical protein
MGIFRCPSAMGGYDRVQLGTEVGRQVGKDM